MRGGRCGFSGGGAVCERTLDPRLKPVEINVDDGRGEEREHLAENQSADDGDAQWTAQLGADTRAEGEGHGTEKGGHRGHQNWPETQQTRPVNRFDGRLLSLAFKLDCKINHENGVFLDEADQKDDADQRDDVQIGLDELNGEEGAGACRRNRGECRDGLSETLIEYAGNGVTGWDSRDDQNRLIG